MPAAREDRIYLLREDNGIIVQSQVSGIVGLLEWCLFLSTADWGEVCSPRLRDLRVRVARQ